MYNLNKFALKLVCLEFTPLYVFFSMSCTFFSLSGHRVGKQHFYSATKFAMQSLTEGVRWELRGINSHIRITVIHIKAPPLLGLCP